MFGGIGSEAISAVPVRANIRSTSGTFARHKRFQTLLHFHRLRQAGARYAQGLQGEIAFTEARHKLAAHATGDHTAHRDDAQRHGECHCIDGPSPNPAPAHTPDARHA